MPHAIRSNVIQSVIKKKRGKLMIIITEFSEEILVQCLNNVSCVYIFICNNRKFKIKKKRNRKYQKTFLAKFRGFFYLKNIRYDNICFNLFPLMLFRLVVVIVIRFTSKNIFLYRQSESFNGIICEIRFKYLQ